jgi:hypothetical protein
MTVYTTSNRTFSFTCSGRGCLLRLYLIRNATMEIVTIVRRITQQTTIKRKAPSTFPAVYFPGVRNSRAEPSR